MHEKPYRVRNSKVSEDGIGNFAHLEIVFSYVLKTQHGTVQFAYPSDTKMFQRRTIQGLVTTI